MGGHNKLDNHFFWNIVHYLQSFNVQNLSQIDDISKVFCMFKVVVDNFFFSNIFFHTKGAPFLLKIENDIIIDNSKRKINCNW
jgi:hypothetical protein